MSQRLVAILVVSVALPFTLLSCSSSKPTAGGALPPTSAARPATGGTTSQSASGIPDPAGPSSPAASLGGEPSSGALTGGFCTMLSPEDNPLTKYGDDPASVDSAKLRKAIQIIEASAPAAIKDDIKVFGDALVQANEAGTDGTELLSKPEVVTATKHVSEWFTKNCLTASGDD